MDRFVTRSGKKLRLGFTTGSAAALAAKAAVRMLLSGKTETEASLVTPKGLPLAVALHEVFVDADCARCAVRKDAGDDPDATDGVLVFATVRRAPGSGIVIDGGEGVGRVTKPGLDQPVGAAAINSTPRRMIAGAVREVCGAAGYGGGISVVIGIPGGEAIAAKTFNPRLGIVGGLSVIGTTGIVEPMSTRAVVDTVRAELSVIRAGGAESVVLTPGNCGEAFLRDCPALAARPHAVCSNFIGEALDAAAALGFRDVLVAGHIGKLIKLAGGVMDTHSRAADCRLELLALGAALHRAEIPLLRRVLDAVTVDDGLDALGALHGAVVGTLLERAEMHCARRAGDGVSVGVVVFSNRFGLPGMSAGAEGIMAQWEKTGG